MALRAASWWPAREGAALALATPLLLKVAVQHPPRVALHRKYLNHWVSCRTDGLPFGDNRQEADLHVSNHSLLVRCM